MVLGFAWAPVMTSNADDAVVLVVGGLRRRIALALLGHHVDEHRPVLHVAHVLQDRQQLVEVVAVDRADVIEAEFLEQGAAGPEVAAIFLGQPGLVVQELRQAPRELLGRVAQRAIGAARDEAREIGRHRAGRRRDRHVVVVEDDDEPRAHGAGVVHRLVGHSRRHRAVADHRDHVVGAVGRDRAPRPCPGWRKSTSRNGPLRTGRIRFPSAW